MAALTLSTKANQCLQAGLADTGAGLEVAYLINGTAAGSIASYTTGTTTVNFLAGQLTGGGDVTYVSTATTPGSIQTRTATQMFTDQPYATVGQSYILTVINLSGSANTMTITAGSGVTLTSGGGGFTIAQNIARVYIVTFNTATTLTIQEMYAYTAAA